MSASILAVGMVTALGLDWETSCAASRGRVRRASRLEYFPFQTERIGEPQFATGHQVDLLTSGFEGFGRLVRLLSGALSDLARRVTSFPQLLQNASFYLSLPDPERARENLAGDFPEVEPETPAKMASRLLAQSAQLAGWRHEPILRTTSLVGHAGFADILQQAMSDLTSGRVINCIVGGVDSLLDEETLSWLVNSDRLKHPAHAAGLTPGEGCALLLLSSRPEPLSEICCVEAVSNGQEDLTLIADTPTNGGVLWRTAQTLTQDRPLNGSRAISLTSDHNGEVYRAREFGGLLSRFLTSNASKEEPHIMYPAASFGDTAAASGAIAAASVARSFAARYAPAHGNIILSSSDGPERSAFLVTGPKEL